MRASGLFSAKVWRAPNASRGSSVVRSGPSIRWSPFDFRYSRALGSDLTFQLIE